VKLSSRRVTIRDVALRAGVGIATVSRALNGDPEIAVGTRVRVQAACHDLGYEPSSAARSLKRGKSENIGVAIMSRHAPVILNPYYAEVLGGVEGVLEAADYHLLLSSLKRNEELLRLAKANRVDGLLVIGCDIADRVLGTLAKTGIPLVLIDNAFEGLPSITVDHVGGATAAVRHLLDGGYRRIAFVTETLDNFNFQARLRGYRGALAEAGIACDAALTAEGGNSWEGGYHAMKAILARVGEPPEAVFGANDPAALTAFKALQEVGCRVPEDVAVVGFDDIHLAAHHTPPLSTVRIDKRLLGRTGAEMLLARIHGASPEPVVLATELVVRGSSRRV
jgi:DNA-binding LacI/PurR family transcriptional regulator